MTLSVSLILPEISGVVGVKILSRLLVPVYGMDPEVRSYHGKTTYQLPSFFVFSFVHSHLPRLYSIAHLVEYASCYGDITIMNLWYGRLEIRLGENGRGKVLCWIEFYIPKDDEQGYYPRPCSIHLSMQARCLFRSKAEFEAIARRLHRAFPAFYLVDRLGKSIVLS